MKYVATVEVEFETNGDPMEALHYMMLVAKDELDDAPMAVSGYADAQIRLIEKPRELG